ncbi:MAG: DUF6677 family protein [Blastocatellia bacterium]
MSNQIPVRASSGRTAAACVASFVLPGLGHVLLGRWVRGLLLGGAITLLFVFGLLMEGHLFKPEKEWLTWFFSLLDAGIGLPYLVCLFADWGFQVTPEQAAKVTFEYGNNYLCVAGALNMLAAMDAFDIGIGRKA